MRGTSSTYYSSNISFVAVWATAPQKIEADPEVVNDMVSITRGAMAVRGTAFGPHFWGMLYADDAVIVSKFPADC